MNLTHFNQHFACKIKVDHPFMSPLGKVIFPPSLVFEMEKKRLRDSKCNGKDAGRTLITNKPFQHYHSIAVTINEKYRTCWV